MNGSYLSHISITEKVKTELTAAINSIIVANDIPCYFLVPVFQDFLSQITATANSEIKEADRIEKLRQQRQLEEEAAAKAAIPTQEQPQTSVQPQIPQQVNNPIQFV